ncbi:unnamed protein product [Rotaria sordida]|uniref:ubiquitinyl hydrolase 1 n=1 Tax=Rotaria sordida TaxID=392033 RepID=A0A814JJW6_9BILA|nr:unnamed protein product [Rotaria sordida]CAF3701742.1 unnamed protein product [Rotaria sordida]
MSSEHVSYSDDHRFTSDLSNIPTSSRIELQLYYNDYRKNLKVKSRILFSPTDTIHDVIKEFLKTTDLDHVSPSDISLVGLGIGNQRSPSPSLNTYRTLEQLNIKQGHVLYFEPSTIVTSARLYHLTIWGPSPIIKAEYEWNSGTTTLKMLLEYAIRIFLLESIERQRIHLFHRSEELDLSSNSDKLLIDLEINDRSFIDVEIIPPISYSNSRANTNISGEQFSFSNRQRSIYDSPNAESNQYIQLQLHYKDDGQNLNVERCAIFSLTDPIHVVIKRFLDIGDLYHIYPDDISLVALSIDNQRSSAPPLNANMTLHQLNIKEGHSLYFEPSTIVTSARLYHLTIWGPSPIIKAEYEWNSGTTTLKMLFEYVIKEFLLESIEQQRIHLYKGLEELDLTSNSDKLLSKLGIIDQTYIFVEIVPSYSSSIVHVECAYINGTQLFDVPNTTTIDQLKNQIEQRFKDYFLLDLKLFNRMHDRIDLNESKQILSDLGIKPGQTIYAAFHLTSSNNQSSIVNPRINMTPRSSSLIAKNKPYDITVNVKFSKFDSTFTTEVSINDTVDDLIKMIESFKKSQSLDIVLMSSGSTIIDNKKFNQRLTDIGIKSNDIIDVIAIDKTPTYYSNTSSYITTPYTSSRPLEMQRFPLTPIGLYNFVNTCYMNSALQCLVHAKPLTQFFLDGLTQDVSDDDKYVDVEWNQFYTIGTVTGAYADLLKNLCLSNKTMNYSSTFRPTHLREIIGVQAPRFATSDQQDAQEFMTFLLDEIHRELKEKNGNESNTIIEDLFFGKIQSTITCLQCKHEEKTINPISFLPLPLTQQGRRFTIKFISRCGDTELAHVNVSETGQVKNLIEAFAESCSHTLFGTIMAMTNDEQLDLEMPLNQLSTREIMLVEKDDFTSSSQFNRFNRHSKKLTLESCLREFCSLESLEDSWLCQQETCKKTTNATKQLQFCSLPTILIIQFKRFLHQDGLREKLETFVDYPINALNLSHFISSSSSSEQIIYDLFAVCKHTGSIYGGHYITCARHETNGESKWYRFDDSFVSSFCYNDDIVSKDAYLLFYIKRENPKQLTPITTS